jgi:hypothetical protein
MSAKNAELMSDKYKNKMLAKNAELMSARVSQDDFDRVLDEVEQDKER